MSSELKVELLISDLLLDATTPFFLPNKSHLVVLLMNHIHTSHHHIGLSQTLSLYRQHCWTPKNPLTHKKSPSQVCHLPEGKE